MLQSVDIVPPAGVGWPGYSMPVLGQFPDLPFNIRKIDGLEPVAATINTEDSDQDGDLFLGTRRGQRNIVLTLGLNYPIDSALGTIYSYFLPERPVTLKFIPDGGGTPKLITGYVEDMPHDRFTDDPEMTISIICPKPDFMGEFPLTRMADDGPAIGQGAAVPTDTGDAFGQVPHVSYNGTLDGPFELVMTLVDNYAGDIRIQHYNAGSGVPMREFVLNDVTIAGGRELYFSSLPGKKIAESRPGGGAAGVHNSLVWAMDNVSWWLSMFPGENTIKVVMPSESGTPNNFTVTVYERFAGLL